MKPAAAGRFILALVLSGCAVAVSRDHSSTERAAEIDQYLKTLEGKGFAGTVLAALRGKVILERGYGLAHRERRIPVTTDTVFPIGSITKQFTAAAILKLQMQGKLSVDDSIAKFVSGVPPDKAGITLHHLLTHSAGLLGNYGPSDFEPVTREELIKRIMDAPLNADPGSVYDYSNAGYSLLAAVVEIVSGQPYEGYLSANLFAPAGMTRTGYRLPKWPRDSIAQGYVSGKAWGSVYSRYAEQNGPFWNLLGNGGIHSTVKDMYRWHKALEQGAILSEELRRKAYSRHIPEDEDGYSYYGYGWAIFDTPWGTDLITHNGGNGIFFADFLRFLKDDACIVFLTSTFQFEEAGWEIAEMLLGRSLG
jgi:CubicO group peptidase (beta-lactamase class C family)